MLLESLFLGAIVGMAGTLMGGASAVFLSSHSLSPHAYLSFAGGIMVSVVVFEMLPQSAHTAGIFIAGGGAIAGGMFFALLSPIISTNDRSLYSTGILVITAIALHNFPEGLAIGASFASGIQHAFPLSLLLLIHNIPEGIAACLPLCLSGVSAKRVLFLTALTGLPTAAGSVLGTAISQISGEIKSACISFSAGAMLYISLKELIPAKNFAKKEPKSILYSAFGFCIGIIITMLV